MNHWVSACACACVYVGAFTGEASRSGVTEPKNKCIYRFGSYFQFALSGHFALPPAPVGCSGFLSLLTDTVGTPVELNWHVSNYE